MGTEDPTAAAPDAGSAPAESTPAAPAPEPTSQTEPAPAPAAAVPADQQPAPAAPATQAEYTRAQQWAAGLRTELGLGKDAKRDDVIAAVQALKVRAEQAPAPVTTEDEDPRIAEANARAFRAEVRVQAAIYGEDFTMDAIELINKARTSSDAEELITALAAFRDAHPPDGGAAPAAPATEPAPAAAAAPTDTGLSEGDATSARQTPPAGRREPGAVSAVRGLFKQAAEAARGG